MHGRSANKADLFCGLHVMSSEATKARVDNLAKIRILFIIFTVRLHVMQRTVLLSEFCPSVRCVYCDKTKQRTANILIPHETAITLVF